MPDSNSILGNLGIEPFTEDDQDPPMSEARRHYETWKEIAAKSTPDSLVTFGNPRRQRLAFVGAFKALADRSISIEEREDALLGVALLWCGRAIPDGRYAWHLYMPPRGWDGEDLKACIKDGVLCAYLAVDSRGFLVRAAFFGDHTRDLVPEKASRLFAKHSGLEVAHGKA